MPLPLEQFVKQLEDSGILAGETLKDFIPPKASPKDAEDLARELVRNKKLTKFQAEEVYKGKAKSLVLGNYVLMEKIGAGGMGQVFKARHRRMDRFVAVKLLPASMTKNQAAIARFEREVKAAAKLRHPNIVAADDADYANGVHFLVMELVEGNDLSALVKKNGPFSVDRAVNYILQAARGLEAAHKKGVVHRDIKPANLLLDGEGTVKILDMGLARLDGASDAPTEAELTKTGTIMGTVDYMAPEQALNTKLADTRADIYSLGCSLFYLVTGKATFAGETLTAKLIAHQTQPIPSLRAAQPEVPEQVEAIFRKMMAKKVEERYQTATALIADLEQCCSRQESSVNTQPSFGSSTESGLTNFLKDDSVTPKKLKPPVLPRPKKAILDRVHLNRVALNRDWFNKNKKQLLIGAGVLGGLVLLAGVIVSLRTKDGTLTVKVNEPDAEVQVLTEEGKVEITRKSQKGRITISVDPGKHRLKVVKDGFEFFAKDFEMESGGNETITARLVPLDEKPAVAAAGWHGWPAVAPPPAVAPFDAAQAKNHQVAWAKHLGVPVEYTSSIGMKFMLIPPGEFTMGSTVAEIEEALKVVGDDKHWQECVRSEAPQHKVVLTQPIYLGVHEVTQKDYEAVMGQNPSLFAPTGARKDAVVGLDTSTHPVEMMSWNDAAEFCGKLSEKEKLKPFYFRSGQTVTMLEGTGYRLPSEAQWEFACRAGTTTKYWIGDKDEDLPQAAWFGSNSGDRTHAIAELKANPFGLFDIHGNTWEWVHDGWEPTYYGQFPEKPAIDPSGPASAGSQRVIRGGDWSYFAPVCRSSHRNAYDPSFRGNYIGFRLALAVDAVRQSTGAGAQKPLAFTTPGFGQWTKEVAALPAEQQVEAVSKKLVELNPGFDGKETHHIENGVVTEFNIAIDNVTDISPVRVLSGLKVLRCNGIDFNHKASLADISPLKGMTLNLLRLFATQVSDLSPLQGMPLLTFDCYQSRLVSDLSPLSGMQINALECTDTQVSDLSPLKGMPLVSLHFGGTKVSDLSLLKEMKLTDLICGGTAVSDLSPIKNMPLTILWCDFKPFRDTDLLRSIKTLETINNKPAANFWKEVETQQAAFDQWMNDVATMPAEQQVEAVSKKLQELNPGFDGKVTPTIENGVVTGLQFLTDNVTDISPVRALERLKRLACEGTYTTKSHGKLADLSPLKEMSLADLQCGYTQVSNLSPLKGMPLVQLECFDTPISDLSPLFGMPLDFLNIGATKVSDLSPLKRLPLTTLHFSNTQVSDLSPLKGMSLTVLGCANTPVADLSPLMGMPLTELGCQLTHVSDLSPLSGAPLTLLNIGTTEVSDLSPLKETPLIHLGCDFKPFRDTELLRSIKTLETINSKPVADFWQKVEAQQAAFDQWVKDVAAMPAEQQVEAVSKKLQELNPGFDGKVSHDINSGAQLAFFADDVTDISPVRALVGLKVLNCSGSQYGVGKLLDLSPLSGMALTQFSCVNTQVSDLSPLKGMPLIHLGCAGTQVSDLSSLDGMELQVLSCQETNVESLVPLRGMPLAILHCNITPIADLSPLQGMPLTYLNCSDTQVSDLSPLKGMPLTGLTCHRTQVSDFSPLKDLPLNRLDLDFKPDRDTELLRSIKTLESINGKPVAEFWKEVEAARP